MKQFGYIEGYYGKKLRFDDRKRIIDRLSIEELDSYLIASKEDIFHRLNWRETPPKTYFVELYKLIKYGAENRVTVIPAIAPGLNFTYGSQKDYEILRDRLLQFRELGAVQVSLLMDDIDAILPEDAKEHYSTLGEAHGELLTTLQRECEFEKLIFCPTIYTNEIFNQTDESELYLEDLKKFMPKNIQIFWTGENTVSEEINRENCKIATDLFGEDVIIWDNFYANDYAPQRVFLGHFSKRDLPFIEKEISGIMINATGLIETDLFLISLFGLWRRGDAQNLKNWRKIATKFGVVEGFEIYLDWFSSPFKQGETERLKDLSQDPMKYFREILVQWQHPLKLEWYNALHYFFTELKLVAELGGDDKWFKMRFLENSAEKLFQDKKPSNKRGAIL